MAAVDYFLKLDGIDGDSADKGHEKWIEVLSYSWGVTQTGTIGGGGGGGAGKANFQDFHFAANFSKASPQLFKSCATGQHIKMATLIGRNNRTREDFETIKLADVLISSYSSGGAAGDSLPVDQFSLNFAKIDFNDVSFDVRENTAG